MELKELIGQCKKKKHVCPLVDKLETFVEIDGETYKALVFLEKKRKKAAPDRLSPNQIILEYYKRLKGIPMDDPEANKMIMGRHSGDIKRILDYAKHDLRIALKAIEVTKKWNEQRNLMEWNLGTITKQWYNLSKEIYDGRPLESLTEDEKVVLKEQYGF